MNQPPLGRRDARYTHYMWERFRRIMVAMAAAAMAVALAVVAFLWWRDGALPWVFVALTIGGVWATVMMAALLMGLMFVSSSIGHDAEIDDQIHKELPPIDED